jgi:hypothetical protein
MSPAGQGLRSIVEGARRVLRRDAMLTVTGVALAAVPVALMVAFMLGRAPAWLAPSPLPLLLELCALALAAAAAWFAFRRWVRGLDEPHVAAAAEQTLGMAQGSLRGVLELGRHVPEGTSPALFRRAEAAVAQQLHGREPRQLTGATGVAVRRRMARAFAVLAALSAVSIALGFASPKRSKASWAPLLHPVAHLSPPALPTLVVEPGNAEVQRGGAIDVRVQAPGRLGVEVHWRAAGDVPRVRDIEVLDGLGATQITNIDAAVEYWVSAPDGAISETYRITPVDPLLLSELVVDITFPAYLNRPAERYEGELPPLRIPAGSSLQFQGRSTRPLMSVALERADGTLRLPLQVNRDQFSGRWAPQNSGIYGWKILGRNGGIPAEQPTPIDLMLVPDSAPRVEITFPEPDTTLGPDMLQQVLATVRDDYGLRGATLISWRVSSLGDREPALEQPLVLEGAEDRANIQTILDASDRRLLPGDTLHYMIRAADNSPSRQTGVSPVYTLRLPTLGELRANANDQADKLVKNSRELSQSLKQLQDNTRDFQRQSSSTSARPQQDRANQPGGKPGEQKEKDKAGFEKTEQGKQMVERQEAMLQKAAEMREEVKKLEQAMQAAGLQDPELQKRMAELKQLYDQMLTPEMKQKLSEMKKSMEQMDPEQMKRSMEQLAKQQEQLKKQIDQSLELLRRAAAEQKMNSLAQHAKELSTQEQALAEALKRQEPPKPPHDDSDGHHNQDNKPQPPKPHDDSDGHHDKPPQPPKAGEQKPGDPKTGEQKAGEQKAGEQKAGEQKAGEQKAGEQKAGEQKAGEQKAGEQKAGEQKAGEQKAGDEKAGEKNDEAAAKRQADIARQTDSLRQELDELQKQLSEQGEKKAAEQTGKAGQQTKEAQQSMKQAQQQSEQKQGEQASKSAEQGSKKLDEASKTLDQARQQMANQWKQQTQQQVQQAAQEAQQLAQRQNALQQKMQQQQSQQGQGPASQDKQGNKKGQSPQANPSVGTAQSQGSDKGNQAGGQEGGEMKSEQAALQQSLEQIGRNIADASQKSAMVNKDVGQSLGRAMLSMEQTMNAMQQQGAQQRNPSQEAAQTVNALNKLALALANNSQQISQSESGTGLQEALQQMAELAKQQGAVNGQTNSLVPLDLSPASISQQMQRLAQQQREIAQKLGSMQNGVKDDQLGRVDQLAKEADEIARELSGNRLSAEMLARQERLFHKLLDAGRTLEKDDVSNQRVAERPGTPIPSNARGLDPALMDANGRFRMPSPDELKAMPPAYRRLILEYFDRLNKNPDSGNTSAETQRQR